MSIVRNSVLDGNGLTTDLSSSVVVWTNVVVSGVTYTFCEYITTTETGNPTYIRDVPHLGIVRPTGHDYYPCHNGTTYGVYDKITHTFTPKTVTAHGTDQPYGVGIWDLMWATASGYTDLLFLVAADGGTMDVITDDPTHPIQSPLEIIETRTVGGSSTTKIIKCAFNVKDMPLPPTKTVVENSVSVTYSYAWGYIPTVGANGDLTYGRKPRWELWADGAPLNIRANSGAGKWLIPNILVNNELNLKWWDGYNNSKVYPPFLSSSENTWEIEYHNGTYLRCSSQLRTAEGDRATPNPTKQLWLYDLTATNLPAVRYAVGNLVNWDGPSKGTMKVDIYAFMAAIMFPTIEVDFPLYIVKTLPFWSNGAQAATAPAGTGAFNSSTASAVKEIAKEGKSGGAYYDFTTGGTIVSNSVANALYPMLQRNNGAVGTVQELILYTPLDSGDEHTETNNIVKPIAFSITKKDEGSSDYFRIALRTPTLTIGSNVYTIINGVYYNGNGVNTPNDPSQFVFSTNSSYTKSGLGMTFLCEQNGAAVANSGINCICVMELTVCDANKNVIGYGVFAKRNSKGIYYFQNTTNDADPDEEYRNSPFTYLSGTSFTPTILATAKLTNGSTAYPDYDQYVGLPLLQAWEKAHTMKVAWWYGQNANEISSSLTNTADGSTILKPNSTAVIGMYGDKNVLIPGFSTATDADWYEGGTLKGNLYNPSVAMFFTGFRGWEFNLTNNSHKVFVFPYENVVDNNDYTILYFKRYKAVEVNHVLDHYITDNSSTPNTSINEVGTTTKAYYVLLFEFTNSAGTVSRGGGAFLKYDSVNFPLSWKLFSWNGQSANMDGVDIPTTSYHVDAYLDYIPDSAVNSKFFEVPQGLLGITNTLTTHGVFKLRIKTTNMPILGTLRWSIQDA